MEQALKVSTLNHPIDVPTLATISFIESNVTSGGTILEVGCGSGHVASNLTKRGYTVIGVESDRDALAQARNRGVEIIDASWPDVNVPRRVDAVVFTRSLHHIAPLPEAIEKIRDVLLPNGTILVEDFAFDAVTPDSIEWILSTVESPDGQALISHSQESLVTKLRDTRGSLKAWYGDHDHELHAFTTMEREIAKSFSIQSTQQVPYLYRYFVPIVPDTPKATTFIAKILDEERHLANIGAISLIGRRIVAAGA